MRIERILATPRSHRAEPERRRRRGLVALAVAVVLIAVGVAAFVLARGGPAPVSYAFPAVTYPNHLVSTRVWSLSGGHQFQGTVGLNNASGSPLTATVEEAIPKGVAASAGDLTFQPRPTAVVRADPVVAYSVDLGPGGSFRFRYSRTLSAPGNARADLTAWATDQAAAQAALEGVTLTALSAGPSPLSLVAGESVPVPVSGTMSDGSPASPAVLAGVAWASSNPAVATVNRTALTALRPGTATLTGQTGTVTASLAVTVVPGSSPPAPPTQAVSTAPSRAAPPPHTTPPSPPAPSPSPPPPPPPPPSPSPEPSPSPSPVTLPKVVYLLYRAANYDWLYTSSTSERAAVIKSDGYVSEGTDGIAFYGCQGFGAVTVYRLYNATTKVHLFTADRGEEQSAISKYGFKSEPNTFSACNPSLVTGVLPVYRLSYKSAYLLTPSAVFLAAAEKNGWVYQGIAFYAYPPPGYSG